MNPPSTPIDTIVWLRNDLRLANNPALYHANGRVACVFILEDHLALGAASRWWLHHSLFALHQSLADRGIPLYFMQGAAEHQLTSLMATTGASKLHWNRRYEPNSIAIDTLIKTQWGKCAESFNGHLLVEPWQLLKADQSPYRVFTPYWKQYAARHLLASNALLPAPNEQVPRIAKASLTDCCELADLNLLPPAAEGGWEAGLAAHWTPGEHGAHHRLQAIDTSLVTRYDHDRDFPALPATTTLSAHLHFGEISPQQVVNHVTHSAASNDAKNTLIRQLAWRDFAHYVLFHFPETATSSFNPRYRHFPYTQDDAMLRRWQRGTTGIPIIDAGMRELWHSGIMHNRVRMLVGSLLSKNMNISWQHGAAWFWDTLVDADLANNQMGWQWVAGSGVDAAPYFRIFNPVTQGQKFDKDGTYIRRWVPELAAVPNKWIHTPWLAPSAILNEAKVTLGNGAANCYPLPILDIKESRQCALDNHRAFMDQP